MKTRTRHIAVVGSGPAGLYTIGHLLEKQGLSCQIDLYERLPTPWGLVRSGVAPDHPEKKLIIDRLFDRYLRDRRVHFIGNVTVGEHVTHDELVSVYDAVVYAVGATGDVALNVEGENLAGCHSAREFVEYYNGHPDAQLPSLNLATRRAVIVGNGNVALDVARILTTPTDKLKRTDIADRALAALQRSLIEEVIVLGRRGPLQAAFHNPEIEELEQSDDIDLMVDTTTALSLSEIATHGLPLDEQRKIATLRRAAARIPRDGRPKVILRFLGSPVRIEGSANGVTGLVIAINSLRRGMGGRWLSSPTGVLETIPTGLVFRAAGYRNEPSVDLPFDHERAVIRNSGGRVMEGDAPLPRTYVVGWAKRGCRGVIGSNKRCAGETAEAVIRDLDDASDLPLGRDRFIDHLRRRHPRLVELNGWLAIDRFEQLAGRSQRRPRVKLASHDELLACSDPAAS